MAAAECSGRRRFAVACGVLSRCIRAEAAAAASGKVTVATPGSPHPTAQAAAPAATMLLMPGADVAPDVVVREEEAEATPATKAQLTIMYGGRVLVFDDVPEDKAAALVHVAARQDVPGGRGMATDVPVERKASLQRFMEKRRERRDARAPYAASACPTVAASKKGQEEGDAGSGCWLGLGITGGCAR